LVCLVDHRLFEGCSVDTPASHLVVSVFSSALSRGFFPIYRDTLEGFHSGRGVYVFCSVLHVLWNVRGTVDILCVEYR